MSLAEPPSILRSLSTEEYPYETSDFHQCWWTYLAPKFDIPFKHRDLLIHRKPVMNRPLLRNVLTFDEVRIAGWNNAWSQDFTEARLNEFMELDAVTGWDYLRMTCLEKSRPEAMLAMLQASGYPQIELPGPPQYVVDLSDGFENYLGGLSRNSRKSIRKKIRRAEDLNPQLDFYPARPSDAAIEEFFACFFEHHLPYWDAKAGRSYFHDAEERSFIVNWIKALRDSGHLVLDRVLLNGQVAHLSIGVVFGSTFYWLLSINTGPYQELYPALVGLYLRLQWAEQAGITHFNMGPGDYPYKLECANRREFSKDIIVLNPRSFKAKAYGYWIRRQAEKSSGVESVCEDEAGA